MLIACSLSCLIAGAAALCPGLVIAAPTFLGGVDRDFVSVYFDEVGSLRSWKTKITDENVTIYVVLTCIENQQPIEEWNTNVYVSSTDGRILDLKSRPYSADGPVSRSDHRTAVLAAFTIIVPNPDTIVDLYIDDGASFVQNGERRSLTILSGSGELPCARINGPPPTVIGVQAWDSLDLRY